MERHGVLGVDGGQSAIRVRHSGADRVVEVEGVSRLEGDVDALVAGRIGEAIGSAGFPAPELAVLGLTTAPADPRAADRLCDLVADATGASEVWLADDAVTAHAGALSLGDGVSVVAGTGVACLVLPPAAEPRIVGGHGFLLGDEGGAYWIGRRALNAVLRAAEGRHAPGDPGAGPLATAARARYHGDIADLHVRLHEDPRAVDAIARFAQDVGELADRGDRLAEAILAEAVRELVLLVEAAAQLAESAGSGPVPVALGGRPLAAGAPLRRRLDAALAALPGLAVRSADATALDGALLIGAAHAADRYGTLVHRWTTAGAPA